MHSATAMMVRRNHVGYEMLMFTVVVAGAGAWIVSPQWAALIVTATAFASLIAGIKRPRWLVNGGPLSE